MEMTFRWYGTGWDTVKLEEIRQIPGVKGVITTLYDTKPGEVWSRERIRAMKEEVEKAGLKVEFKRSTELELPEEFQVKLDGNPSLKKSFTALTPGRQRAYVLYFSAPKQSQTRESRIEKYIPHILAGKGMND